MIKSLFKIHCLALIFGCLFFTAARAQVDANFADQAALDGVKGLGPVMSHAILAERRRNGLFKDWPDLERRVKGMGEQRSLALSEAGLLVDGRGRPNPEHGARRKAPGPR
ncbi:MAG: hypothetical protein JWP36_807 [Paucimonas sp.]|nr:hypothetical protein [Paucimonas sp.]